MPFMVHEQDMARLERSQRRAWITAVFLATCLVITNAIWIFDFQKNNEKREDVQVIEQGCVDYAQENIFI